MRSNTMKSINDIQRDGKKQADPIRKERLVIKARDIDAQTNKLPLFTSGNTNLSQNASENKNKTRVLTKDKKLLALQLETR